MWAMTLHGQTKLMSLDGGMEKEERGLKESERREHDMIRNEGGKKR